MTMTLERAGVTPGFKTCRNPECPCENPQPLSSFGKISRNKDGKNNFCQTCYRAKTRGPSLAWRNRNLERARAAFRSYRAQNYEVVTRRARESRHRRRDKYNLQARQKREANLEAHRAYGRAWEAKNREKRRAKNQAYWAANRDRLLAGQIRRRQADPANRLEIERRYREKHPGYDRAKNQNRRARLMGALGTHTAADVAGKLELQGGLCYYCQTDLSDGYQVDHKIALARGGTNWPANICCACPSCNARKSDKPFLQFISELATA